MCFALCEYNPTFFWFCRSLPTGLMLPRGAWSGKERELEMFIEEGSQVKVPKTEQPRRVLAEGSHEGDGNTPPDSQAPMRVGAPRG